MNKQQLAPHRPAAFINALAEEGSKEDAIRHLQKLWNELGELKAQKSEANPTGLESRNPYIDERNLSLEILSELARAREKFLGKNVTFAALIEEVGELATALFEESASRVREEAIQVAVMAMRVILDGDHCFEPWRLEKGLDPLDAYSRAKAKRDASI